jgi:hypothetical protein
MTECVFDAVDYIQLKTNAPMLFIDLPGAENFSMLYIFSNGLLTRYLATNATQTT